MTSRTDIVDASDVYLPDGSVRKFGLVYTRLCGWVDLGHANPDGAKRLWDEVRAKTVSNATLRDRSAEVVISYSQSMKKMKLSAGVSQSYRVKKQLTSEEQKSIALAIFMDVSFAFEKKQSNWFFGHFTNSGYSAEDLVSNLIGFYRAVEPSYDFIGECEPTSKEQAYAIWDAFGEVGKNKNYQFRPFQYPDARNECGAPTLGKLPPKLNTILPAPMGVSFQRIP